MVPLLNQPAFQKRALPLSVKAWHSMIEKGTAPDRSELIRGVIVEKMPKSILHIKLVSRLLRMLQAMFESTHWVRKEDPLTLADSEPEPDLSVVTGHEEDYANHPATAKLVIEVTVSTLAEDREMASLYAEAGVGEFWIVNASQRCIELHQQPASGRYQVQKTIRLGETAAGGSLPGLAVNVAKLFEGLPAAGSEAA